MPDFIYDVAIEGPFTPVRIDWGSTPGWLERERKKLDAARHLILIPKEQYKHSGLPVVSVQVGDGRRWIIFSRVFGQIAQSNGASRKVRLYCIGWQSTVGGANVQSKIWVYPNGVVEAGDEPSQVNVLLSTLPFTEVKDGSD